MYLILCTKRVEQSRFCYTQYTQRTSYSDRKGVTDERHLTEKFMSKLQNLYGIALEQNVY